MRDIITYESTTDIETDLITHYAAANYQVHFESTLIDFHINQHSEALSQLFSTLNRSCAIFITAFNPHSRQLSIGKNLVRNTQLRAKLDHISPFVIEGTSTDVSGTWPVEKSFLAFGIDVETGKTLGREFDQNAIVWINANAIPQLVLLR